MTDFGFIFLGFIIGFLLTNSFVVFYAFKKKSKYEFVNKYTGDVYEYLGKVPVAPSMDVNVVLRSTKDMHLWVEPLKAINDGTSAFKKAWKDK